MVTQAKTSDGNKRFTRNTKYWYYTLIRYLKVSAFKTLLSSEWVTKRRVSIADGCKFISVIFCIFFDTLTKSMKKRES